MPRRASSGISPAVLIGLGVLVVVVLLGGRMLPAWFGRKAEGFRDAPRLRVEEFLENANSMRGNEYSLQGTIDEKLRWTPDHGQVVSVKVEEDGRSELIAVEIPPEFNHLNIEREQRYAFKVKIRQGGIPVASAIQRM